MSTPTPAPAPTAKDRPGQLRARVAQVLTDQAGTALTVTAISRILGRSAGAVGNAAQALVERGEADLAGASPRRFAANDRTATAASAVPGPAPVPPVAAPVPARPAAAGRPIPIRRPNGQDYHPRALAGMADVEVLRRLREASIAALLYGPPGTGKTSLIEAAFPDLLTVAGDGDTTVGDLIGEYTQTPDGGYEFVYGPLVVAMTEGRALLIDDATLISPKVLAALYPAMDGRRQITVKAHKGETITAADGFYPIAGHNPGVHGAILTEALSSRFAVQVQVGSDYDLAHALKIDSRAVRIARNLAARVESGEAGWAPQLRELIAFQKIAAVLGDQAAFANLVGVAPIEDRDLVAELVAKATGTPAEALRLGPRL
ncbi:hypothetical protein BIV57_11295 [Mangrovactinospora gilvigrisea]|uniref:ATPase dynein-related AAA domain-containing protein n=1 Tax=Mangrovactinospora gilvigrisea TaxID=1428644 RepID=A0A1J7CCI7_9ACTN|nr:AAA family ATPase [Mangrovactinospora gilvigrisea]OIV37394.1 hypothetical protein BIV57_11295 [Mangrovactinospora gilvigrisea]